MLTTPEQLKLLEAADTPDSQAKTHARERMIAELNGATPISRRVLSGTHRVLEGLQVAALGLAIASFNPLLEPLGADNHYLLVIFAVGMALPALGQVLGLYSIHALLRPFGELHRIFGAWSAIFAAITATIFMSKVGEDYSRAWLSVWYAAGLLLLIAERFALASVVRHWNHRERLSRRAILVGGGQSASDLLTALEASRDNDVEIVGIFDDRDESRTPASTANLPRLGSVAELVDFARKVRLDLLIITLPLAAENRLLQILRQLWVLPVDIRLSAYAQKLHYRPRAYSYIGNVPFLDVYDKPLDDWDEVLKAVEDRVLAALAIIVLSPLMLLIALAVKLDSKGPILFKQKRFGFNNEEIDVYKFRSLYHEMRDIDAAKQVTKDDPRVTRVGRIIRKTSLDELPQFFNVLFGSLSLVGPRPHATKAKAADVSYNEVIDGYFARHRVKPGITGWAQINGWRGETDTVEKLQRRVEHDLYYIENWSIPFDLYILLKTPFALLKGENAY